MKWARCTYTMTLIFFLSTLLVHFYKADFMNLTVCVTAIFFLTNVDRLNPGWFRVLVAGIIVSGAYDILWFLLRSTEVSADDDEDGGIEKSIRRFSLTMAVVSLLLKVVMAFVYWMASINFADIRDEKALFV